MSTFTVLGANGFIGKQLVVHLRKSGHTVHPVTRADDTPPAPGHIVYCIGLTADFRSRPFDTVEAHVCVLGKYLRSLSFASFTYLSSTRVYRHLPADTVAEETIPLIVDSANSSDLYNISKLMGESLCLCHPNPAVRVVRISNVYGGGDASSNFLSSLLRDAVRGRQVRFRTPETAAKDYIAIHDVLLALERVPERAASRLINVASGENVSNSEIAGLLQRHTGATIGGFETQAEAIVFPIISIARLVDELGVSPKSLRGRFFELVREYEDSPF